MRAAIVMASAFAPYVTERLFNRDAILICAIPRDHMVISATHLVILLNGAVSAVLAAPSRMACCGRSDINISLAVAVDFLMVPRAPRMAKREDHYSTRINPVDDAIRSKQDFTIRRTPDQSRQ